MKRREFLQSLGLAAAAVSFAPSALAESAPTAPVAAAPAAEVLDGILGVGDVFTIAGRYMVNPLTMQATSHLQQFVVTAVTDGGANISIWPTMKTQTTRWDLDGVRARRNQRITDSFKKSTR